MKTKLFSNILVVLFAIITISWSAYFIYYSIENQPAIAQKSSNSTQPESANKTQLLSDGEGLTTPSRESLSLQDPTSEEDEFDESSSLAYPQIVEGSDIVEQESIPYSDLSTHDTLSYNEKQPAYGLQEELQEELQPPLQMSDLPDESDAGTQLMEDIQGMNIDDEENSAVPQEDELHSQIQEAPVQDTNIGTPLQMFNTENHEQAAPDQAQANQIEEEDNSDAVHSANDIYDNWSYRRD